MKNAPKITDAEGKLDVLLVGMGAVSTTTIGVFAIRKALAKCSNRFVPSSRISVRGLRFSIGATEAAGWTERQEGANKRELAEQLREDIRGFKSRNGLDRLVKIWCGSTGSDNVDLFGWLDTRCS